MSKTLREVAGELGLSEDAVRKRLGLIRPYLNGSIRRGKKGAILLEDDAVEMLLRMEELRKEGLTLAQAAELLTASGELSPESERTPPGIRPDSADGPDAGRNPTGRRPESEDSGVDIRGDLREIRFLLVVLFLLVLGLYALLLFKFQ